MSRQAPGAELLTRDGRLWLEYGPVSMVILAERQGKRDTELAAQAVPIVQEALTELAAELPELRKLPGLARGDRLDGIGNAMLAAVRQTGDPLLTPMAAVAGTIADAAADALWQAGAERVVVNNGGDIALRLRAGQDIRMGVKLGWAESSSMYKVTIRADEAIGGIATSGMGGRSLTKGIADAVTVFAASASVADAFATHLANHTHIDSEHVEEAWAEELDPGTDIAGQRVVVGVHGLTEAERRQALEQLRTASERAAANGWIQRVIASVGGEIVDWRYGPHR